MRHNWHGKIELGDKWLERRMKSGLSYAGGGLGGLLVIFGLNMLVELSGYNQTIFYLFYAFPLTFIAFGVFMLAWRTQSSTMYVPMDERGISRHYFSGDLVRRVEALLSEGDIEFSRAHVDPKRTSYDLPEGLRLDIRYMIVDPEDWKEKYLLVVALRRIRVDSAPLARDVRRILDTLPKFEYPEADDKEV